jgi:hypothetical protein
MQTELLPQERRTADFSANRIYRYTLTIEWDARKAKVQFIGLNPSTADEFKDDNTVRKCKQFAKNWGYGGMVMTNIFAFRSTDPIPMKKHEKPEGEGELNDTHLKAVAQKCELRVAAWGNHGTHQNRGTKVARDLSEQGYSLKCFRITKAGQPEHPLYMRYETPLMDYKP